MRDFLNHSSIKLHLRQYNITPIYVFDGAPPPEKMEEIKIDKQENSLLNQKSKT